MADPIDPIAAQIAAEQRGETVAPSTDGASFEQQGIAPVPAVDPIAARIAAEQRAERQMQGDLMRWRASNDSTDAGRRADVLRYTAAAPEAGLGYLTPEFVEKNLDQVKQRVDSEKVDWHSVAYRQPALVQFLLEKPETTPIIKDDAAELGGLEWALTAPFHAFRDAVGEQKAIARQFADASGFGSDENRQRADELEAEYSNKDYGADSFLAKGLVGAARMVPFMVGDVVARAAGGATAAALGFSGGAAGGGAAGAPVAGAGAIPGAVAGGTAGGVTGVVVGQFLGSGMFNYYQAVGPLYSRLTKLKDADGNAMDPDVARAFAQSGALVSGALMSGFMGRYTQGLPGVKQLLAKVSGKTIEKALAEYTVSSAVKAGVKQYGKHWLTGAVMMGAQSGVNTAAVEAAKDYSDQPFESHWENVSSAVQDGFISGLEDMWLLSALGPAREMHRDIGRAHASAESAMRLESMTNSARASKLLELVPEEFARFVEKTKAEKGAVESVFVPAERWAEYWQSKKLDPTEVAGSVMGDQGKAFADALASKGDLAIPVEKYLAKLAKTEHAAGLAPDSKLRADESTPRQLVENQEKIQKQMEEQAKVRGAELEAGKREVHDYIVDQAVAAGVGKRVAEANAKLVSEYAGTLALRLGIDVREAASLGALGSLRVLGPKGEVVAAAARERFQRWLSPEASTLLAERLASLAPELRGPEYYLDAVTGLRDKRAFDLLPTPDGKQVAAVTLLDVKGINDHPTAGGHDVANDALRAIGAALGEGRPEAARGGTNFYFHVKDAAELAAAVEHVRKALGNDKLHVVGALGKSAEAAGKALDTHADTLRADTAVPERGALHPELDVAGLKFKEGKAKGEVPAHLTDELAAMGAREYAQKAYLDRVTIDGKPVDTGLLSRVGWDNIPRKAHVASLDVKGLKLANTRFGKETGNRLLFTVADALAHFGGSSFDAAHLSGDEFALQHSDPVALEGFVNRVKEKLKLESVEGTDLVTGERRRLPVDFRHGIGRDYGLADRDLNTRKRKEGTSQSNDVGGAGSDASRSVQGDSANPRRGEVLGARDEPRGVSQEAPRTPGEAGSQEILIGGGPGELQPGGAVLSVDGSSDLQRAAVPVQEGQAQDRGAGSPGQRSQGARRQGFEQDQEVVGFVDGKPVTFKSEGKPTDDGPRGTIQLQLDPSGRARAFDIKVLKGDASTMLHEVGHFLGWSLHDVATSALATPDLVADYAALLKWAGYDSPAHRLELMNERQALLEKPERSRTEEARSRALAAKEERISHGFEQYLLEGKAPSDALARVFSKFKGWLTGVYKAVTGLERQYRDTYGAELGMSDEVRGVFSRMLARNEALDQASAETGRPLTASPTVTAAMTPEERAAYREAVVGARLASEQDLARRTADLESDKLNEERARITAEVTAEVDRQPVYRAMRYLQRGELVGEDGQPVETPETMLDPKGKPYKLNRAVFVERYGAEAARRMPRGIFERSKKAGVDVEQLAPLLGFEGGLDLVEAFGNAKPRDRLIEREAQSRIDEAYGPALKRIADAAMAAVHNDDAARATLLALRAMAKQVNPSAAARIRTVDLKTLKDSAARMVGETPVGAIDPARYARAERDSALKAAEFWGAGDKEKALEHEEARLFNQVLYRAAHDAAEHLDKVKDKLESTSDAVRGNLGKAHESFRDVHDSLLAAVGFGEPVKNAATIDQLQRHAEADGQTIDFDVAAMRRLLAKPTEWSSLSVDQAEALNDAITNIRHLAAQANELELAGRKQVKDAWFAEFAEKLEQRTPLPPAPMGGSQLESTWDKVKHLGRGADAILTDVAETYSHLLDVGDRSGPMHRLLVDARLEAREKATKLTKEVLKRVDEAWENMPAEVRDLRDQKVDVAHLLPVPAGAEGLLAPVYDRSSIWMLFLNWGNEGNRQRIRDGNGWTDDNVAKVLGGLKPAEVKFLKGVADTIESLYPAIAELHEKRTGLRLGKVEATPIDINGETVPGHYFPLKYLPDLSRAGQYQEGEAIKSLFAPTYVRPGTSKGHTKERQQKVNAPVDLSWGVVPAHLSQVIHDISYGEWVRQAGGVVLDPRFKALVTQYLGKERADEFVPWLRDVANARADSAAAAQSAFTRKLGSFARNRVAVAVMGHNLKQVLQQVLDPWNASQEGVGAQHIASAYVKVNGWLAGLVELPEFELSKELEYRDASLKDNLRQRLAEMGPTGKGVGRIVSETAFALFELSDRYTTRVTWKAAFDAAQTEGLPREEAAARADDVVRRAYASHDVAEKPPIMRNKHGIGGVLMFYGFANRLYNSQRRGIDMSSGGDGVSAVPFVARNAARLMMLGLTGAACSYLAGRGPKKDEDFEKWLAWKIALEPINTVPFMGSAMERVVKGEKASARAAPELTLMNDTIEMVGGLVEQAPHLADGDAKAWKAMEAAVLAGLFLAGGPVVQTKATGDYLRKTATGETRPRNAADVAAGVVGYDEKRRTPLTDLGDAIGR